MRINQLMCGVILSSFLVAACGSGDDGNVNNNENNTPTEVVFGDTAVVVVINPDVNDITDKSVPTPGMAREGITLTSDDDITTTTGADGIAVLGPLTAGTRTITLSGQGLDGSFTVTLAQGELTELALAADGSDAQVMAEIDYKTDDIVEVTAGMSNQQVNDALKVSDKVVFVAGGTYTGDLDFSGSRVTLFGAGLLGGEVEIDGNVTMSGSDSRIRGATITGDLAVPASGIGVSFTTVDGLTSGEGSDSTFLANALCGGEDLTGSGLIALGNGGIAPAPACL